MGCNLADKPPPIRGQSEKLSPRREQILSLTQTGCLLAASQLCPECFQDNFVVSVDTKGQNWLVYVSTTRQHVCLRCSLGTIVLPHLAALDALRTIATRFCLSASVAAKGQFPCLICVTETTLLRLFSPGGNCDYDYDFEPRRRRH